MAKFKLCPRCELNYIKEDEELCDVCKAQLSNQTDFFPQDEEEICPLCNENPVEPGEKYCASCLEKLAKNPEEDAISGYEDEEPVVEDEVLEEGDEGFSDSDEEIGYTEDDEIDAEEPYEETFEEEEEDDFKEDDVAAYAGDEEDDDMDARRKSLLSILDMDF